MLLLVMNADTKPAQAARAEMIEIVKAWRRGRLLPKHQASTLQTLYGDFDPPPSPLHVVK